MKPRFLFALFLLLFFLNEKSYSQTWEENFKKLSEYLEANNLDSALFYGRKAVYLTQIKYEHQEVNKGVNTGMCLSILANIFISLGVNDSAEYYLIKAKSIFENVIGKSDSLYIKATEELAFFYFQNNKFRKAELIYLELMNIYENAFGKYHPDYITICETLGAQYHKTGQYAKSETFYIEANKISKNIYGITNHNYARNCNLLGNLYSTLCIYEKAEPLLIEAKGIYEIVFGKENQKYALCCNDLGALYDDMGHYEKAEALFIEAKNIQDKILGKEHPDYVASCNNLGLLYLERGEYNKAEAVFIEVKNINEKKFGKDNLAYAANCNNLGVLYRKMDDYTRAESFLIEAKNIDKKILGQEHPDYAQTCSNLGFVYYKLGQFEKAEQLYFEAKKIYEKEFGIEHPDYANICNSIGLLYLRLGQYKKAEAFLLKAKNIYHKTFGNAHPDYAQICNNLGDLYLETEKYDKAESIYIEAKNIQEKNLMKMHPEYAQSLGKIGYLYYLLGQYDKAEPFLIESKNIYERSLGKEHSEYATSCDLLAFLYDAVGNKTKAETFFLDAIDIRIKIFGTETTEYAKSCNNLGYFYDESGMYDKAESLYIIAKKTYEKLIGNKHSDYSTSCSNLGLLYVKMGNYIKAEPLLDEAKNINKKTLGVQSPSYAQSCLNLGYLYYNIGQFEKAERLNIEAKNIYSESLGREHPGYALSCNNLGFVYYNSFQYGKARIMFFETKNNYDYLFKHQIRFQSDNELEKFQNENRYLNDVIYSLINKSFEAKAEVNVSDAYDLTLSNKVVLLKNFQQIKQGILFSNDSALQNIYREWHSAKEQLSFLYSQPIADREMNVAQLEEEANTLEKELARKSQPFRQSIETKKAEWNNIRAALQPGEASIEFVEFQYYNGKKWTDSVLYEALIITKENPHPVSVMLCEKKQLDSLFLLAGSGDQSFVRKLYTAKPVTLNDGSTMILSERLYQLIWQPLESYLKNIKTVYYSPAGLLFRVSFSAMKVGDNKVLSDIYNLRELSTTASVVSDKNTNEKQIRNITLYGGINYDADATQIEFAAKNFSVPEIVSSSGSRSFTVSDSSRGSSWSYLEGSLNEANEIQSTFQKNNLSCTLYSGSNAVEESFKALNGNASPDVLHISTHGFFFPSPKRDKNNYDRMLFADEKNIFVTADNPLLRSGLIFAGGNKTWQGNKPETGREDGILTAYEISNMYFPNTQLAILSACETGLGDIQGAEGVYGLRRAFKMAGVKNLIISLWKVPDKETSEFFVQFYQKLFTQKNIREAFDETQKFMKEKYRDDPYKWASFVLVE